MLAKFIQIPLKVIDPMQPFGYTYCFGGPVGLPEE